MPPTATISPGCRSGRSATIPRMRARSASISARVGGSVRISSCVSRAAPEGQVAGAHGAVGLDHHDLGAAAADVDHEQRRLDGAAAGHADEREEALLVVVDDVERDARSRRDRLHHGGGVVGPAHGLGPDDGDRAGGELPGRLGVARDRLDELLARVRPEPAVGADAIAEAQEGGFVEQRDDAMVADRGDQEVDAGRADVDRGGDHGAGLDLERWRRRCVGGLGVRDGLGDGPRLGVGRGVQLDSHDRRELDDRCRLRVGVDDGVGVDLGDRLDLRGRLRLEDGLRLRDGLGLDDRARARAQARRRRGLRSKVGVGNRLGVGRGGRLLVSGVLRRLRGRGRLRVRLLGCGRRGPPDHLGDAGRGWFCRLAHQPGDLAQDRARRRGDLARRTREVGQPATVARSRGIIAGRHRARLRLRRLRGLRLCGFGAFEAFAGLGVFSALGGLGVLGAFSALGTAASFAAF